MGLQNLDDERVFDRLADGELSEQERRTLLASLDSRSEGWRRCALALLEAQEFRLQFREQVTALPSPLLNRAAVHREERARLRVPTALAVAASALIAFSIGLLVDMKLPGAGGRAKTTSHQASTNAAPAIAQQANSQRENGWSGESMVTLAVAGGSGKPQEIELPLTDASGTEALFNQPEPEFIRNLKRSGHEVTGYREFWPIRMQDGRTLVVPIDDVQVQLIGGDTY